jgi:hypothetical protein
MGVISTQGFVFRLLAGSDPATQLDLFKDEDIKLSNNVTGLFDIGVLPADFTRQITLPGTKVNNAFFEHVYDISIANPFLFATNIKVPCYFDFGGFYLSNGYLQLNKVNVLANKFIESYEVTIFGALSSFGREINRAYLTDLSSLSKYNHTSSFDNISASWNGNLFNGDIVYPLADYGTGYTFTAGDAYFGLDDNEGAINIQDYKPAIRVKAVWDAIFEYAGYTYSSSFMNQSWLDDVYMVCNNALKYPEYAGVDLETFGKVKIAAISGSGMTDLNIPDATITQLPWYNALENPGGFIGQNGSYRVDVDSPVRGILNLNVEVSSSGNIPSQWELHYWPTGSAPGSSYTVLPVVSNYFTQLAQSRSSTQAINQTIQLSTKFRTSELSANTYYYFGLRVYKYYGTTAPKTIIDPGGNPKSYLQVDKVEYAADDRVMNIPLNMPFGTSGIKLVDFISGIQKKFNLVIYPNNTKPNEFIIETFNNWYNKGQVKDFNKYINLDERLEFIPANNFAVNKLNFGDTLDQDYISQQFAKGANREYGKIYYTDTTNFYSQGSFDVKTTFASDPLVRIAGTGLSGSVGGLNPSVNAFYAGTFWITTSSNPSILCNDAFAYDIYSSTGVIEASAVLYFDRYGTQPLTSYRQLLDDSCRIWLIDPATGIVSYDTGDTCGSFGFGCR